MMRTISVRPTTTAETLTHKISARTARVGIVGLGYVGLPLAVEFARTGFSVTGVDLLESKVAKINAGESHVLVQPEMESGRFP